MPKLLLVLILLQLAGQIAYHSPYSPAASGDSSDAVRAVRTLIQGLSGSKALTLRNKRLDCDLAALGALVRLITCMTALQ
jgi:hypothetical protein